MRQVFGGQVGRGHNICACESCVLSKMHRIVGKGPATTKALRPLHRVHFDFGFSPVRGVFGFVGFLLMVDEFTEEIFVYPIHSKSELPGILKQFKAEAEAHFNAVVERMECSPRLAGLRSDGEAVNVSHVIEEWCARHGVRHEVSTRYSPWQDGKAEACIKKVWQGSESLRREAKAPASFWPFSMKAFVYTVNRLALGKDDRSPHEKWWQTTIPLKSRIERFRIWGCRAYPLVPGELRKKGDDKAKLGVHLGYSDRSKAYVVLDLASMKIELATSVVFNETVFPLHDLGSGEGMHERVVSLADNAEGYLSQDDWEAEQGGQWVTVPVQVVTQEIGGEDGGGWGNGEGGGGSVGERDEGAGGGGEGEEHPLLGIPLQMRPVADDDEEKIHIPSRELGGVLDFNAEQIGGPEPASGGGVGGPQYAGSYTGPAAYQQDNPKRPGSKSAERYERYKLATTLEDALSRGASRDDVRWDYKRGFLRIPDPDAGGQGQVELSAMSATVVEPEVHLGIDGEVYPPPFDVDFLTQRRRLQEKMAGPAVSDKTLAMLSHRLEILALASQVEESDQRSSRDVPRKMPIPPATYREAVSGINTRPWRVAMEAEMENMRAFDVYDLVPSPPHGTNILKCKWVYAYKTDADGNLDKLKARLTAKGFTQKEGIDYGSVWAPTCRLRSFRMLLAEASTSPSIGVTTWDLTAAFLQAPGGQGDLHGAAIGLSGARRPWGEDGVEAQEGNLWLQAVVAHVSLAGEASLGRDWSGAGKGG